MQLSYLPPVKPKRKRARPAGKGYQSARVTQPMLPYSGAESLRLERKLRAMRLDDVLSFGGWRLEYLYQTRGEKHYRLYWRDQLRFVQNIPDWVPLATIQRDLAAVLYWRGWDADRVTLIEYGTRCGLVSYNKKLRKPHLLPEYPTHPEQQRYAKLVASLKAPRSGRKFQLGLRFQPRKQSAVGKYCAA